MNVNTLQLAFMYPTIFNISLGYVPSFDIGSFWKDWLKPLLAGFRPNEGDLMSGKMLLSRFLTDRDADLELGLFIDVAPGPTITEATITPPVGTGYARINLTDATWDDLNPDGYPLQTFTAGAGGWTGSVQGYFVATKAAGGTQRLLIVEVDANGPYTFAANDTYDITLAVTMT